MQQPCSYTTMEVVRWKNSVAQIVAYIQRSLVGKHKAQVHSSIGIKDLLHRLFTKEVIERDELEAFFYMLLLFNNRNACILNKIANRGLYLWHKKVTSNDWHITKKKVQCLSDNRV